MQKKCYFGCEFNGPLHSFPSPFYPHETRFNKWKSVLREDTQRKDDSYIHNNVRLCGRHFEEKYHTRGNRLTASGVPTLHLGKLRKDVGKESANDLPGPSSAKRRCGDLDNITNDDEDEYDDNIDITMEEDDLDDGIDEEYVEYLDENVINLDTGYSDFKCNVCGQGIIGFRYSCVQCVDWDMCGACEARGEHATHYVLRVPAAIVYADSQAMLTSIRDYIQNLLNLQNELQEVYCKEEVCDEEELIPDMDVPDPISEENVRSLAELDFILEDNKESVNIEKKAIISGSYHEPTPSYEFEEHLEYSESESLCDIKSNSSQTINRSKISKPLTMHSDKSVNVRESVNSLKDVKNPSEFTKNKGSHKTKITFKNSDGNNISNTLRIMIPKKNLDKLLDKRKQASAS